MSKRKTELDVIIIGGGPAGLSASFWCAELGLKSILFEKEAEFGGQLLCTHNQIKNYLGFEASNGSVLCDRFLKQIENSNFLRTSQTQVVSTNLTEKSVKVADGCQYYCKTIIIATGVRRRKLRVSGELEFYGRGILDSGTKARGNVSGKTVVVVGGGDAALENTMILAESAKKVFVVHRRTEFTARSEFVENIRTNPKIGFLTNQNVTAIIGSKAVEAIQLEHVKSHERTTIAADAILIRVGVDPNTSIFHPEIALDEKGYIITGTDRQTNIRGIFAIGDVANPNSPTICGAVGDGASVAKTICKFLR